MLTTIVTDFSGYLIFATAIVLTLALLAFAPPLLLYDNYPANDDSGHDALGVRFSRRRTRKVRVEVPSWNERGRARSRRGGGLSRRSHRQSCTPHTSGGGATAPSAEAQHLTMGWSGLATRVARPVDVGSERGLRPSIRDRVLSEAVPL